MNHTLRTTVTVTDQFCGAGGSSIGVVKAGAELRLALNHWRLAVDTHNSNFPDAAHDCVDISACDPRRYQATDILITSPECTNHSLAKGAERVKQDRLFHDSPINPSAERSRATMWDVPRFAERHNYRLIIVENVVDARKWRLFDAWLHAMHLLDYEHRIVYFNSMFADGVPQSRDRMYVIFWKRGNRAPNLDFRPPAYCQRCSKAIAAVQSWKRVEFPWGRYGQRRQYLYRCPHCAAEVTPRYSPAWTAIDWTLPLERIGDRKKPLKTNTLRRVEAGLRKFGRTALAIPLDHSQDGQLAGYPLTGTLPTQTTCQNLGLAVPFVADLAYTGDRSVTPDAALPTQTARQTLALVAPPFITQFYNGGQTNTSLDQPVGTILSNPHHGLVVPAPFIAVLRGTETAHAITDPLTTVVACANQHYLVAPNAVLPFLASYYNGRDAVHPVTDPMGAVTTVDRHALVVPQPAPADEDLRVEDCGFRMLVPPEIKRAMAFPDDYILLGGSRQQVRLLGNAVTPPVMAMLFQRCVETLQ